MKQPLLLGFLLGLSAHSARAQQPTLPRPFQDSTALREVVVQAPYRATAETPITFQNLDRATIEARNVGQEPAFLLGQTPGMTVHSESGGYSGYAYVRLRGIDQTRINVTLNGVPLNEPEDQGAYFNNFPDFLNSVESVQIQRGVGTSANGVASYAGSLSFESASLLRPRREVGINYGSFNSYRAYAEYASGLQRRQGLYVRASVLHSDGFKDRSSHSSQSAFYSYGFFGPKQTLKLTGFVGNQRNLQAWIGAPLDSLRRNPRYNGNSTEPDHFVQAHQQAQHTLALGERATLTTTLYYNFLRGNYDLDLHNLLGEPRTDERNNFALQSHFLGLYSIYAVQAGAWKFSGGLHGNLYQRRHVGSATGTGELYRNTGHKDEASAFAQASYTWQRATFFGDVQARATRFRYAGTVALPVLHYQFLNYRAGLRYALTEKLSGYYSLGRTGREPTRNDIFLGSDDLPADAAGQALYDPLPPERVTDHELGVRWETGASYFKLNGYYMSFADEIVLSGEVGANGLPLHRNAARSFRSGLEADFRRDLSGGWRVLGNAAASRNRIRNSGGLEPVLTPTLLANLEAGRQWQGLWLGLNARYQGRSFLDYANLFTLPGFAVLGASAAYQLKGFELSLKVNNLTNGVYYTYGQLGGNGNPYYFRQASINYSAGVKYTF
jgi:iron complex outermembrane receptor protein